MINILGMSNWKHHYCITLEKKQEFFSGFRKLLVELGFEENSNPVIYSFGRPQDKMGEPIMNKEDDIQKYVDEHDFFNNDSYFIDVIFGKDKIFLIVNSNEDKLQEFYAKLEKIAIFNSKQPTSRQK